MSLLNQTMLAINRYQATIGYCKLGTVTSVNPTDSTIKAQLEPEEVVTGFIPYTTPWIGWFAPPSIGDQVLVLFQEGSKNTPIGALLLYWNTSQPPAGIASGEAILHHTSGSYIKLSNDGKITLNGNVEIDITTPTINITTTGDVNINASGNATLQGNNVAVTGNSITLGNGSAAADALALFNELKAAYDAHVHPDPQGGNTGTPTTPLPSNVATTVVSGA